MSGQTQEAKQEQPKEQLMFFSNEDFQLIKNTFAENEKLLKIVRKFFLQQTLSEFEEKMLFPLKGKNEATKLLRKVFAPTIDLDIPLGQTMDLWKALDINNKPDVIILIQSRRILIDYLDQRLKVLEGEEVTDEIIFKEIFTSETPIEEAHISLLARTAIINQIDGWCLQMKMMAGLKEETVEETLARQQKDSNK